MKIVLLGATGNVGSRFLTEAVASGHEVVAYARRPDAVATGERVTVAAGTAEDVAALTGAARGADAVVVAITRSIRDATFMQRALPPIVRATREAGVPRLLLVSAFGTGDTARTASFGARLIYRTVLRRFLADKAAAEAILPGSGLDHTIVYPVNLKDVTPLHTATVRPLEEVGRVPGLPTLPFGDVATALVELVTRPRPSGTRLLITTPTGWRPRP